MSQVQKPIKLNLKKYKSVKLSFFQLRSEEVVSAYIERCRDVQPMLNAVVDTRYDEALREAREADEIVATGKLSVQRMAEEMPLLGVPITVKESIRVQGIIFFIQPYFVINIFFVYFNFI